MELSTKKLLKNTSRQLLIKRGTKKMKAFSKKGEIIFMAAAFILLGGVY